MIRTLSVLFVLCTALSLTASLAAEIERHEECPTEESLDAVTSTAAGISLRECVTSYNQCLQGCYLNCQDTPFPELCYELCSTQCEINLGVCVGVVIVIGVL